MKRKILFLFPLVSIPSACDAPDVTIVQHGESDGSAACPAGGGDDVLPGTGSGTGGEPDSDASGGTPSTGGSGGPAPVPEVPEGPSDDPTWTAPDVLERVEKAAAGEEVPGLSAGPVIAASSETLVRLGATRWREIVDFEAGRLWVIGRDAAGGTVFVVGIDPAGPDSAELAVVYPEFARVTIQDGEVVQSSLNVRPDLVSSMMLVATDLAAPGDEVFVSADGSCEPGVYGWFSCGLGATAAVAGCIAAGASCVGSGGILCPAGGVACGTGAGVALCNCVDELDADVEC